MDKRTALTALVSFAIFALWMVYFAPKAKPPAKAPEAASSQPAEAARATPAATPSVVTAQPIGGSPAPEEKTVDLQTPDYTAKLSTLGASIQSFTLSAYKKDKQPVNLVQGEHTRAVSLELAEQPFPFTSVEQKAADVIFSGESAGLKATAKWHVGKDYTLLLSAHFENVTAASLQLSPRIVVAGLFNERMVKDKSFLAPPPDLLVPLLSVDGTLVRHSQGKKDSPPPENGPLKWVGVDRQYFLIAAAPAQPATGEFSETRASADMLELSAVARAQPITLEAGKSTDLQYTVFVGPKVARLLKESGTGFDGAIDYTVLGLPLGFLSRPMLWILNQAQQLVGSYGWAIAILTLIVKLLLLPVTQKSFVSMQVMKEMKPELDKIKERFPNDREKQGMETMRLYKERGVNPFLSGCLPALLQMPVYFALWRTLWAAVELYQQEFLWFKDLTQPDPYYIVPALLGVTMFFQQKLSPPAGDPQQQKIMLYMMPPLMTSFMLFLPAGLVFYIFINTILTILQQTYISKKFQKKPVPSAA